MADICLLFEGPKLSQTAIQVDVRTLSCLTFSCKNKKYSARRRGGGESFWGFELFSFLIHPGGGEHFGVLNCLFLFLIQVLTDAPLVESVYLVFKHMPCMSYRR